MMSNRAEFELQAWVDESVHNDHGLYVLAAAVADPSVCEGHRNLLRTHVRSPRHRLHWVSEERKDRARLIESLAALDLAYVVTIAGPLSRKKTERARRKCFERLLLELGHIGVTTVWVESRGPALDQRDKTMTAAMRSAGMPLGELRIEFSKPLEEPMLWIPDAVAGAVAAAKKGTDVTYREAPGSTLTEFEIAL